MSHLPEVYQIEVGRACNFACPMCPTQFFPRKNDLQFLELQLLEKIVNQGALENSYFIELQMGGEPLLHPQLKKIISLIKDTGVKVGLSTNGYFIKSNMAALMMLDAVTVSVDSLTNYEKIRKHKHEANPVDAFIDDIKSLLANAAINNVVVDLQIIELEGWEEQMPLVHDTFKGYDYNLRSIPNGYLHYLEPKKNIPLCNELCINPWMSVSIQCNGNVTACCVAQGDDLVYGNLYSNTLQDIWASDAVETMRTKMRLGAYPDACKKCYTRSPALFHLQMMTKG